MFNSISKTSKLLDVFCDFLLTNNDVDFLKTICQGDLIDPEKLDFNHGHIRAAGKFGSALQSFRIFIDTYKMLLFTDFPLLYDAIKHASDAINTETIFESTSKNASNIEDNGSVGMLEALIIRVSAFFLCFYHNLSTIAKDDNPPRVGGSKTENDRIDEICSEIERFKKRLLP